MSFIMDCNGEFEIFKWHLQFNYTVLTITSIPFLEETVILYYILVAYLTCLAVNMFKKFRKILLSVGRVWLALQCYRLEFKVSSEICCPGPFLSWKLIAFLNCKLEFSRFWLELCKMEWRIDTVFTKKYPWLIWSVLATRIMQRFPTVFTSRPSDIVKNALNYINIIFKKSKSLQFLQDNL